MRVWPHYRRITTRTGAPGHLVRPSCSGASVRPTIARPRQDESVIEVRLGRGVRFTCAVTRQTRDHLGRRSRTRERPSVHSMTVRAPRIPGPGHEPSNRIIRPAGPGRGTAELIARSSFERPFDRSPGYPGGDRRVSGANRRRGVHPVRRFDRSAPGSTAPARGGRSRAGRARRGRPGLRPPDPGPV
jgi:hypothetical protein